MSGSRRVGDKLLEFYIVVASVRGFMFILAPWECVLRTHGEVQCFPELQWP